MRNRIRYARVILWPVTGIILVVPSCADLVRFNALTGVRDGAVTATTGLIEGFFDAHFGLGQEDGGGEGGANDLFIHA